MANFGCSTGANHSRLIGPQDRIWKTTGRLRCLNLGLLDHAIVGDVDLACDLHNVPFVGSGKRIGGEMMDLRLFAFRRSFYDRMLRDRWRSAESDFDARMMYWIAMESSKTWSVLPRFPPAARYQRIEWSNAARLPRRFATREGFDPRNLAPIRAEPVAIARNDAAWRSGPLITPAFRRRLR